MVVQREGLSSRIPQLDGPIPDPYDDMLSTPNVSFSSLSLKFMCVCIVNLFFAFFFSPTQMLIE